MPSFTNTASDRDLPANALSFPLAEQPAAAIIDGGTGALKWTTRGSDAGSTNRFTVVVRDNGVPSSAQHNPSRRLYCHFHSRAQVEEAFGQISVSGRHPRQVD